MTKEKEEEKEKVEIEKDIIKAVISVLKETAVTYHYLEKDNNHIRMTVEVLNSYLK